MDDDVRIAGKGDRMAKVPTEAKGKGALQRKALAAYVVFVLGMCMAPFVGMAWAPTEAASGSPPSEQIPSFVREDGSVNIDYLSQLGAYFEEHFAYRNEAIDIDARIKVALFATSPTDQVVVGSGGWLYYGGTLSDYLARDPLSEREAASISHNLALVQGYTQAKGADLVFTIAPNKNSLYPEYMPYYHLDGGNRSIDLLSQQFEEDGIPYVDMFALFNADDRELYFKTDSHWNAAGALLAANALLEASGKQSVAPLSVQDDPEFTGDIEAMLYPVTSAPEPTCTIDVGPWDYMVGSSVEDSTIETGSEGEGGLLMFRDSFANSLIPLMAPEFETAHFSKLIPYNLALIDSLKPDTVIIERAERHLDLLLEDPPIMPAPRLKIEAEKAEEDAGSYSGIEYYQDGDFMVVQGWVDESIIGTDGDIYLRITDGTDEGAVYVPYHITTGALDGKASDVSGFAQDAHAQDYGFRAFLPLSSFAGTEHAVTVLVVKSDSSKVYAAGTHTLQR